MPQSIPRVERKRRRQNRLGCHLDGRRKLLGLLYDLLGAERLGRDEVGERESVEEDRETDARHTVCD